MPDKPKMETQEKQREKPVSEVTYSLGNAVEKGLKAAAVIASASFLALYFGRKEGNFIDKVAGAIENTDKRVREAMQRKNQGAVGTALAVSLVIFAVSERLIQIPAFIAGRKKAKQINQEFADLSEENEKLKHMQAMPSEQEELSYGGKTGYSQRFMPESDSAAERVKITRAVETGNISRL